ncbi:ATP-binding protein [Micromonospora sp. NPDC050397]|uniref:ATP-binding protein n=1 Tax=Micromonospora sp. NPDC050397 TaxID=3364279 RepID=UPI0038514C10
MSNLADEIVKNLARRQGDRRHQMDAADVDALLQDLNIPTTATKAVPVPLRAARIHFRGTKLLKPSDPDAVGREPIGIVTNTPTDQISLFDDDSTAQDPPQGDGEQQDTVQLVPVPFHFEWHPQSGVNGIGSGRNLRGKSTILNVLMWSLTGRCARFQPDIKLWIEHVEVDWTVGPERLRVTFDARDGKAAGQVLKLGDVGGPDRTTVLGDFDEASFERVMGSLMMPRLHLERIPVWTEALEVVHTWPVYASSFVVRAKQLDPIVGNEQTLGIRMMQMFVGTDWVPAHAAAAAAKRSMETTRRTATEKAKTAGETVKALRDTASQAVDDAKDELAKLPSQDTDLKTVLEIANRASELSRQVHQLDTRLLAQTELVDTARQQLRAARARAHTHEETALATKFFHRMRPSVCPRCTAEVTAERQAAEPTHHRCSVCTSRLNLEALEADVIVAATVPPASVAALVSGATSPGPDSASAGEQPVDDIEAAAAAVAAAEQRTTKLQEQIREISAQRDVLAAEAEAGRNLLTAADQRRTLELTLARAEGALAALNQSSDPAAIDPVDPVRAAVADAAEQVLQKWVKDEQDPLLARISAEIENLADSFGAGNLRDIKLNGSASMSMYKSAAKTTYSSLTDGEKLRLKIATAIALINHGFAADIGRHPGLLVLDSPAAEEMPDADLATMVEALQTVAQGAEMQIFVATRNAGPLLDLLPTANRIVAEGDTYVW